MIIANQVQASPGLYINTPGQPMSNVGLQPNESTLAAMSRGAMPANAYITNEGVGGNITLAAALSTGTDGGNQSSPANGTEGASASGGGAGAIGGSGGMDVNANFGATGDVALAGRAPAANISFQGGAAATQYAG